MGKGRGNDDEAAAAAAAAERAEAEKAEAAKAEADAKAAEAAKAKEKEEADRRELEELRAGKAKWDAVKPLFKEGRDGALELDPSALPPSRTKAGEETEEEVAAAAAEARRKAELDAELSNRTGAAADKIAKDLDVQRSLEEELKAEPGGDLIMKAAKAVMSKVPLEKRTDAAWRNAFKLGRGETEPERRKLWEQEGSKRGAEELLKVHKIRIPRPASGPKSPEEAAADLTPAQLKEAERRGMTPEAFAKRLLEIGGGRR